MLVIGTSDEVYTATTYVEEARRKGFGFIATDVHQRNVRLWYFQEDAAKFVPRLSNMRSETCDWESLVIERFQI